MSTSNGKIQPIAKSERLPENGHANPTPDHQQAEQDEFSNTADDDFHDSIGSEDEERQSVIPPTDLSPPPDGGLVAWTQVFMSHLVGYTPNISSV